MCFSAEASFTAALLLTLIGIFAIKKNEIERFRFLSFIPFIFGIQQFFEGLLWLSLGTNPMIESVSTSVFLGIAILVWPFYVPMSLYMSEQKVSRRKPIKLLYRISLLWVLISAVYLIINTPTASGAAGHIAYSVPIPGNLATIATVIYLILTIVPFFLSSERELNIFGVIVSISAAFSYLFWSNFFVSIWCFFAAIVSSALGLIIYIFIRKEE